MHGDQLTFQIQLLCARSWAIGYEGARSSRISILPTEMPETELEFGTTISSPEDGETVAAG